MQHCFVFFCLSLSFLALRGTTAQDLCPDPVEILPCNCSGTAVDCSLATSSDDIYSAFNDVVWPFLEFSEFFLTGNDAVPELPEGIFGAVSFGHISIDSTSVAAIHPLAILPLKERIWKLQITNSALGDFPWDILPQFSNLTDLFLYGNPLTTLPRLDSASLKQLILFQDEIATIESVSSLPNLEVLHMASNPLSEIPIGFFSVLGNLDMFFCQSCSLGPTLATGILTFSTTGISNIFLNNNSISRIEPHAISGFGPETTIHLHNNEVTELAEEVFRPMLQILSQGSGKILLVDNPVDCGCSIAWWVLNPQFYETVYGSCADGNSFQSLNPDDYQDCIRDGQIHSA